MAGRGSIRFTKAERAWLFRWAKENRQLEMDNDHQKEVKVADAVLAKLETAEISPATQNADAGALERALLLLSGGRVVPTTAGGYARVSKVAGALGVTVDQITEVGRWLARQRWLTEPVTILTVLNKWAEWYPRARATATPAGQKEGLGGGRGKADAGSGADPRGAATAGGRPAAGLGRARPVPRPDGVRED